MVCIHFLLRIVTLGVMLSLAGTAGQQPTLSSKIEYVQLDSAVTHKDDRPVSGLSQPDFVVEHGQGALAQAAPGPTIDDLLDLYHRGDNKAVAQQLADIDDPRALDRLDADLKRRAMMWVEAGESAAQRRRLFVAGAVALELTHALVARESWSDNDRSGSHLPNPEALPYINRVITGRAGPPDALEYAWTLAQLATWQEWNAIARVVAGDLWITPEPVWAFLLGKPALFQLSKTQLAYGQTGYLGQALARFPRDPQLLLARMEAVESIETRCARNFCYDEMTPAVLEDLRTRAKRSTGREQDTAVANLAAFARLVPVAAAFATLAGEHPVVRAEANAHIGYLAFRAGRPDAALVPLATAVTSEDPFVRYLAELFTGRALAALGRQAEAIAAYRRALLVVPNAPSAATLLGALLLRSDDARDRLEASSVLRSAMVVSPSPLDPWDLYWYGDARRRSAYMEQLQQRLRP